MRPVNLLLSWYLTVVLVFTFALLLLVNITYVRTVSSPMQTGYQKYKALPSNLVSDNIQQVIIKKEDGRAVSLAGFFKQYNSQMAEFADTFIKVADRYRLDFRLLPAIAMQESNGAKRMPKDSYNPFGYGIYGSQIVRFNSYEEAIDRVGRSLREDYLNQGLKTPLEIMSKYTPPSLAKGGAWAIGVAAFMEQLR